MRKILKIAAAVCSAVTLAAVCPMTAYPEAAITAELMEIIRSGENELINVSIIRKENVVDEETRYYSIKEAENYYSDIINKNCELSEEKVTELMTRLAGSVNGNPDSYIEIFMYYYKIKDLPESDPERQQAERIKSLATGLSWKLDMLSRSEYNTVGAEKIIAEENLDPLKVSYVKFSKSMSGQLTPDEILKLAKRDDIEALEYIQPTEQEPTTIATSVVIVTVSKDKNVKNGDLNGDNRVNVADLVLMQRIINKDAKSSKAADMNNDGAVDVFDVILLKRIILGV